MNSHSPSIAPQPESGLRSVAILVFTAKIVVATFLLAQVSLVQQAPLAQAYGLQR